MVRLGTNGNTAFGTKKAPLRNMISQPQNPLRLYGTVEEVKQAASCHKLINLIILHYVVI
jgi:hypothetical protein